MEESLKILLQNSFPVLVVDDMPLMRKVMRRALEEMGFTELEEAEDGAIGWTKLSSAEKSFRMVVSDWNMPNMTGLELLKNVRGDERFKSLPFVLCTLESERGQVIEAVKLGVSQYIIKPFTNESFREKIDTVLKKLSPTNPAT